MYCFSCQPLYCPSTHHLYKVEKQKKWKIKKKPIDSTTEITIVNTYVNSRVSLQDKKLQVAEVNPEEEAHM